MITNSYDVVLIGAGFGNLVCGALLTKRGFRVLVVGQDSPAPQYTAGPYTLPRAPFTDTTANSPMARRIYAELGLTQILRRRSHAIDPTIQLAIPGHRFELPLDAPDILDREIEREFPAIKRPIDEFFQLTLQSGSAIDSLIEADMMWPPDTFLERRRFRRAARDLPASLKPGPMGGPLDQIPARHPFRLTVDAPLRFSSHLDAAQLTPLAVTRLYDGWLRGPQWLSGGYSWLQSLLIDKIRTSTGDVRLRERVEAITIRRGATASVQIAGAQEEIGCDCVISGIDLASLLRLLPSREPFVELFDRIGEPQPRFFRYTLNLMLRSEGVPEHMARDVFFVRDTKRPLADENLLRIEAHPPDAEGHTLLCVEALLSARRPRRDTSSHRKMRHRILDSVREVIPFMDNHLLLVDSPHDGHPIEDLENGTEIEPKEPWSRGPATMRAIHGYPVLGPLGLCALPIRSPIRRLLLCGAQIIPGLGLEGELLAAWSATKYVTHSDRRKEWMRKSLWTKVEL